MAHKSGGISFLYIFFMTCVNKLCFNRLLIFLENTIEIEINRNDSALLRKDTTIKRLAVQLCYFVGAERPKLDGDGGGAEMRCCNSRVQFFGVTMPEVLFFASSPNISRSAL